MVQLIMFVYTQHGHSWSNLYSLCCSFAASGYLILLLVTFIMCFSDGANRLEYQTESDHCGAGASVSLLVCVCLCVCVCVCVCVISATIPRLLAPHRITTILH